MSKVLITGGFGFIGSNLAKRCVDLENEVTLISRSDSKRKNIKGIEDKVEVIIKDVRDIGEEVQGMDHIFHLAGSVDNYALKEGKPYRDIELNCMPTIALLEACRQYNPSVRVVFASTFFVNGRQEKLPVDDKSPCTPLGLYGATRLAAEHFCHVYNGIAGLNIVIARFTNVFGENEQRDNKKKAGFNYLINLAVKGKDIPLYENGNFFRDYIHVDDVSAACIAIAKRGEKDHVYYVGRGEFIKFKELIDMVIEEAGSGTIKPIEPPEFHKRVGIRDFVCDNTPLRNLGWKPKVPLREGIRRTVESYRKNG